MTQFDGTSRPRGGPRHHPAPPPGNSAIKAMGVAIAILVAVVAGLFVFIISGQLESAGTAFLAVGGLTLVIESRLGQP